MPPRAATLPLLLVQGDWLEALELARVTRAEGSPLERHMAVAVLGYLSRHQGNPQLAWEMVQEILPKGAASQPGDGLFPYAVEILRLAVGLALDDSDVHEARSWLETHDQWLDWSGAFRGWVESNLLWAQVHQVENDLVAAASRADDALKIAADPCQPLALLASHHTLGDIAIREGRYAEADRHLTLAMSMADACAARFERARVLTAQCELSIRSQQSRDVATRLQEARSIAEELEARPLLVRIDALEAQSATSVETFDLTARETEVLRLLGDGLTDAAIAEHLYISPRTVGQHLRSIYNKLGVSSRTAATKLAMEHQLI